MLIDCPLTDEHWTYTDHLTPPIRTLAPSIRKREVQIYNAVTCQMSNARVEATNCHLRSLTKRSYGFHTPGALIAMANLTRGGACPELPHRN
ncbi:transposase [Gordonia hongkongensis]|uniref:transposase n=1 Tax=Gordonia hongkongensis TaxID=1701090 RepID=UPI001FFB128D|nr:transposase [Gordonia hongkongensis]UPG69543.1 transposase [Gordonia hongkongensis]